MSYEFPFHHRLHRFPQIILLNVRKNTPNVMQRNGVTKHPGGIKWMKPRSFTPLRSVQDDKGRECRSGRQGKCFMMIFSDAMRCVPTIHSTIKAIRNERSDIATPHTMHPLRSVPLTLPSARPPARGTVLSITPWRNGPASVFGCEAEVHFGAWRAKSCLSGASSFCLAQKSAGVTRKLQAGSLSFCYFFFLLTERKK